jgi:hypothetical protein
MATRPILRGMADERAFCRTNPTPIRASFAGVPDLEPSSEPPASFHA